MELSVPLAAFECSVFCISDKSSQVRLVALEIESFKLEVLDNSSVRISEESGRFISGVIEFNAYDAVAVTVIYSGKCILCRSSCWLE